MVESLVAADLSHNDHLWIAEAKRSRDEIRNGRVETVPGDEVLQKMRDVVRK